MEVAGEEGMEGGREHGLAEAAASSHAGAASHPGARPKSGSGERERMLAGEREESECVQESGGSEWCIRSCPDDHHISLSFI